MARGQAQAADTQRKQINEIGGQQLGQSTALENQLIPSYTSMLNEGYTPAEEAAQTTAGMGAVGSNFDTAAQESRNTAARTNNPAGVNENLDKLALERGTALGDEAAGLQKGFADTRLANQRAGQAGLAGLESGNLEAGTRLYGLDPALLGARAAGGGWAQGFHDVASGIGSMLSPFKSSGGGSGG